MDKRVSLIAAAMTGVCVMPLTAQAQEEENEQLLNVYGRVNVGVQSVNDDGVGTYGQDESLGMQDVSSRLGVRGEHDLGNGLTGMYRYEFAVDATNATLEDGDRLSWIGLRGDFGQLKAGRMWSSWYTYLGWNTDRSQFWGGPGYYANYEVGLGGKEFNIGPTTRSSDTIQYTFGGGGYSSDPFTFTVETVINGSSAGNRPDNMDWTEEEVVVGSGGSPTTETTTGTADPQDFDLITLAGQTTFGSFSLNAAFRQRSSNDATVDADPSQAGVGVRWNSGPLYIGGSYIQTDRDDDSDSDSPSVVEVLSTYDFGGGLSGQLSVSQLDNDMADSEGDTTGVFALINQDVTEKLNVYGELQRLDVDGGSGGDDTTPRVILVGMGYSFP